MADGDFFSGAVPPLETGDANQARLAEILKHEVERVDMGSGMTLDNRPEETPVDTTMTPPEATLPPAAGSERFCFAPLDGDYSVAHGAAVRDALSVEIPSSLVSDPALLREALSWKTWRSVLSAAERDTLLRSTMPAALLAEKTSYSHIDPETGESVQISAAEEALRAVLMGENIFHGNPVELMAWMVNSGVAESGVATERRRCRWAERRRFEMSLEQRRQTQLRRCMASRVLMRLPPQHPIPERSPPTFATRNSSSAREQDQITPAVAKSSLTEILSDTDCSDDEVFDLGANSNAASEYDGAFAAWSGAPSAPAEVDIVDVVGTGEPETNDPYELHRAVVLRRQNKHNTREYEKFAGLHHLSPSVITALPKGFSLALDEGGVSRGDGASGDVVPARPKSASRRPPPKRPAAKAGNPTAAGAATTAAPKRSSAPRTRLPPHQKNSLPLIFTLFRTVRNVCQKPKAGGKDGASFSEIVAAAKDEQSWLFERYMCASEFDSEEAFIELLLEFLVLHPATPPIKRSGRLVYADPLIEKNGTALSRDDQLWRWVGSESLSSDRPLQSQEQLFWFSVCRAAEKTIDCVNTTLATRSQKSAAIARSPDAVRMAFRKQEFQRYDPSGAPAGIPFCYKMSRPMCHSQTESSEAWPSVPGYRGPASVTVHPIQKGSTLRPRDHYAMLPDRPPEVSVLCVVRDAVGRLPGSIGTRPDVAQLLLDSQYVNPDVTEQQLNAVVSGALDRLHSQDDPCVQFDAEQKLWVFVHRGRDVASFSAAENSGLGAKSRPMSESSPSGRPEKRQKHEHDPKLSSESEPDARVQLADSEQPAESD